MCVVSEGAQKSYRCAKLFLFVTFVSEHIHIYLEGIY